MTQTYSATNNSRGKDIAVAVSDLQSMEYRDDFGNDALSML